MSHILLDTQDQTFLMPNYDNFMLFKCYFSPYIRLEEKAQNLKSSANEHDRKKWSSEI